MPLSRDHPQAWVRCRTFSLGFGVMLSLGQLIGAQPSLPAATTTAPAAESERTPHFCRDIAPLIYHRCSGCHRPGQSAPFSLLNYADVRKRLDDIRDVTANRSMPPWAPEPGYGHFAGERRLTDSELAMLQRWIAAGAPEGNLSDLPPPPRWDSEWQLGTPDLVVQVPAYTLGPDGPDLYRNFVVPIPTDRLRHVRGVEFRPGNPKVVHHAFFQIDETRRARKLASRQDPPGYDGMESPETVVMPGGQLLGFQPGKAPSFSPPGLAWNLQPGTDLVLQVHMNRSGRPEVVQPSVGFYFTDQAPTNRCFRLKLAALTLDIPAGATNHRVSERYTLPVDVQALRISAHAHYLGKELSAYAVLPSGKREELIRIRNWDFKWQGDYGYAEPVFLPKGSVITLDYTYDNSSANPRNPYSPPRRTRWGLESRDEMGELTLQLLPATLQDWQILARDYARYYQGVSRQYFELRAREDPKDALAQRRYGRILAGEGNFSAAISHLEAAIRLEPDAEDAHGDLGGIFLRQNRLNDAFNEFKTVVRLNPDNAEAYGSLGVLSLRSGQPDIARTFFERALELNPRDTVARQNLEALRRPQP